LIGNVAGLGHINVFDPATGAYLGMLRQPDGTPIAITGLWDLEFGDGTPEGGKTNQLFFDAGPNAPGVSINGLFGVIHAAGDQGDDDDSDRVSEAAAPSQPMQQALAQVWISPKLAGGGGTSVRQRPPAQWTSPRCSTTNLVTRSACKIATTFWRRCSPTWQVPRRWPTHARQTHRGPGKAAPSV
jgi:hypothetical protein